MLKCRNVAVVIVFPFGCIAVAYDKRGKKGERKREKRKSIVEHTKY